jgi:magnesium-transporting ATPase (P-type)
MQKQPPTKEQLRKEDIIGSETVMEKIKRKTPWILGSTLRKPKVNFPKVKTPRLSLPMPSRSISIIAVFVVLFILQTGVSYLLVREPPALGAVQQGPNQGDPLFIITDINEAFIIESIVASILILLCSTGFIFLYQASKYVYNRKMALTILAIGVLTILITFIALQYIIAVKTGVLTQ